MAYTAGQKLRASAMSVYVCTSSTRPAGHSGQLIYETDTGMYAAYDGSTWRYLAPDGTGSVRTDVQFNASVAQSIPNSTYTIIAFGTDNLTSSLVTKATNGAGHQFTLNRAGVWSAQCTLRYVGSANARETYGELNGTPGVLAAASQLTNINVPTTIHFGVTKWFAAGTVLYVRGIQSSGGNLNTDPTAGWTRLNLAWLHS